MKKEVEIKWRLTQNGNTIGWMPQYKDKHGDWRNVPTKNCGDGKGIRASKYRTHAIEDLGLFTYAQAMALAWGFAAGADAEVGVEIEVRVQEYEVVYDIKARVVDADEKVDK